jgi:hypothetical protein
VLNKPHEVAATLVKGHDINVTMLKKISCIGDFHSGGNSLMLSFLELGLFNKSNGI